MPASYNLGYTGTLWYFATPLTALSGAGSALTVTWVAATNVMDVDATMASDSVDVTTRVEAATGWSSDVQTLRSAELTFTMRVKQVDTATTALLTAWNTGAEIALLDLSGTKGAAADEGHHGISGNFTLSLDTKRPIKGVQVLEFKASLSSYPLYVKVNSSGALIAY